jgi:hypothetical protein
VLPVACCLLFVVALLLNSNNKQQPASIEITAAGLLTTGGHPDAWQ